MTGGLNNDVTLKTQVITQGPKLFFWRVAGCVFAFGCVWKYITRTENMAMCIHGAGW